MSRPRRDSQTNRFSLRAILALLAVLAIALAMARPMLREGFRGLERRAWIALNRRDMDRHLDVNRIVPLVNRFAEAIASDRLDDAYELTAMSYRRAVPFDRFADAIAPLPLDQSPREVVFGVTRLDDVRRRLVSEYDLAFGPRPPADSAGPDPRPIVRLTLVTEAGQLCISRIDPLPLTSP
ncbi:hypothetical protein [Tautonia rosea]|uniref:hypothetical protein n=1 Tax=Tautonia rosea TaxID=2728037 RepID=UPI0014760A73|nr:hypothetical protein [Tautonia rosea]